MYDYINGTLTYKIAGNKGIFVTVENNGIGYSLEIMEKDFQRLPEENQNVKIYTVLLHREDKMSLCGFLKREERDIYNVLTSVSGVGTKMALTLMNFFDVCELVEFVLDGDYKQLTKAKGVGPKLAQKIILELKDKLNNYKTATGNPTAKTVISNDFENENVEDARMVMISLGYEKDEINSALMKAIEKLTPKATAEEILKDSLKILSR